MSHNISVLLELNCSYSLTILLNIHACHQNNFVLLASSFPHKLKCSFPRSSDVKVKANKTK